METSSAAESFVSPNLVNNINGGKETDDNEQVLPYLPPGFRFHPTDEEIILHYLRNKVVDYTFTSLAIGDVDLNKSEPWDLPRKAKMMGKKEWFFFWHKDRKYPTGMRTNRATEMGYWKATGKDKHIFQSGSGSSSSNNNSNNNNNNYNNNRDGVVIGMKKTLVFYKGRAPKGQKTNWIMHEYRFQGNFSHYNHLHNPTNKDEWVVCRVFHKNNTGLITRRSPPPHHNNNNIIPRQIDSSLVDHFLQSAPSKLPPLVDFPANSDDKPAAFSGPLHRLPGDDDPDKPKAATAAFYPPHYYSETIMTNKVVLKAESTVSQDTGAAASADVAPTEISSSMAWEDPYDDYMADLVRYCSYLME